MNFLQNNSVLQLASRLFVGMYFIIAAVSKITDPALFAEQIDNYRMVPDFIQHPMALILPWLEFLTGIMLIIGARLKATSGIMIGLMLMFTIAVFSAWMRDLDISCGCISTNPEKVGLTKVLKNLGLTLLLVQVYFSKTRKIAVDNTP